MRVFIFSAIHVLRAYFRNQPMRAYPRRLVNSGDTLFEVVTGRRRPTLPPHIEAIWGEWAARDFASQGKRYVKRRDGSWYSYAPMVGPLAASHQRYLER